MKDLPLKGIKVLDMAVLYAGPFCATILSDFGAEVVKIEHPDGDPLRNVGKKKNGHALWFKVINRNKKAITINLKQPEGQGLLKELAKEADVIIENFRPGTLERWNIGWDELSKINPRLIMLRITAFGQDGPYSELPGFGTLAEALSGMANLQGFPDGPPVLPPVGLVDHISSLVGAFAVMTALYERDVVGSNKGQCIDLSLLEPLFHILGSQVVEYDQLGVISTRTGNRSPSISPRNCYQTKDGKWLAMTASTQTTAVRILNTIDPNLCKDPRFLDNENRVKNGDVLDEIIAKWCAKRTLEEAMAAFKENKATVAPVYTIDQIFQDEHFKARSIITEVPDNDLGRIKMQNVFVKFSRTPGRIVRGGPKLGEDNYEIFINKLGKSVQQMKEYAHKGIVIDNFNNTGSKEAGDSE